MDFHLLSSSLCKRVRVHAQENKGATGGEGPPSPPPPEPSAETVAGHAAIRFSPMLYPVRIPGTHTHALGINHHGRNKPWSTMWEPASAQCLAIALPAGPVLSCFVIECIF